MLRLTSVVACAAIPLAAGSLTQKERETLLLHFDRTAKNLRLALDGVSDKQWTFKPSVDAWSIAECAEHIVTTDQMMFVFVKDKMMNMPAAGSDVKRESDESVLASAVDRSKKVKTMEFLEPKARYPGPAAVLESFSKSVAQILDYVTTTQDDLRAHGVPTPGGTFRDAYQCLLSLAGHIERHTAQIAEVKSSAGYPKN